MARSAPRPLEKPYKNHRFTNSVPDGSKLWYFRYRFGGKENRLTFGPIRRLVHGGAYGDDAVVVRLSGREPRGGRCALYLCPAT